MAYCPKCGKEMEGNACSSCGYIKSTVVDNGGFGWGLLGFCIPLVGLILFLVWHSEKPNTAKAAGIGALIAVILGFIYYIIIGMVALGSM